MRGGGFQFAVAAMHACTLQQASFLQTRSARASNDACKQKGRFPAQNRRKGVPVSRKSYRAPSGKSDNLSADNTTLPATGPGAARRPRRRRAWSQRWRPCRGHFHESHDGPRSQRWRHAPARSRLLRPSPVSCRATALGHGWREGGSERTSERRRDMRPVCPRECSRFRCGVSPYLLFSITHC